MVDLEMTDKFTEGDITEGLSHEEFRCKCKLKSCGFTLISPRLINSYAIVRGMVGPLLILSGFRCQVHNHIVGGHINSYHKKGMAIDLAPTQVSLKELYKICLKFFDDVVLYEDEGFVHCEMEDR